MSCSLDKIVSHSFSAKIMTFQDTFYVSANGVAQGSALAILLFICFYKVLYKKINSYNIVPYQHDTNMALTGKNQALI